MLMKKLFMSFCLLFGIWMLQSEPLSAQEKRIEIKGKVTTSNNQPLEGVNIFIKGSKQGITTDKNGLYVINVPNNKVLI